MAHAPHRPQAQTVSVRPAELPHSPPTGHQLSRPMQHPSTYPWRRTRGLRSGGLGSDIYLAKRAPKTVVDRSELWALHKSAPCKPKRNKGSCHGHEPIRSDATRPMQTPRRILETPRKAGAEDCRASVRRWRPGCGAEQEIAEKLAHFANDRPGAISKRIDTDTSQMAYFGFTHRYSGPARSTKLELIWTQGLSAGRFGSSDAYATTISSRNRCVA